MMRTVKCSPLGFDLLTRRKERLSVDGSQAAAGERFLKSSSQQFITTPSTHKPDFLNQGGCLLNRPDSELAARTVISWEIT